MGRQFVEIQSQWYCSHASLTCSGGIQSIEFNPLNNRELMATTIKQHPSPAQPRRATRWSRTTAAETDDGPAGCSVEAIRRDFECSARLRAAPVSPFLRNYGGMASSKAALPDTGRYAKFSVRQTLRRVHPRGFEPLTFGSVGGYSHNAKWP